MIFCYVCGRKMDPDHIEGWKWVWNKKRPMDLKFKCPCQQQLRLF